ncbi:NADH oxidoreductase Hcr [Paludibacterium purpuratum]|uniref:NADH oxidoreductase Hcr n=1 Tax=Paludibacterium purpuratum TaxID=1144873 RepID=A0A4R7AYU5_9NEIS|nr:NADH oxidoreductase Hcr [Paludibacterium purpuratum]
MRAVRRETPDVWTLELEPGGHYDYLPGQYALVGVDHDRQVRAYTLSSTPGLSTGLSLTVRRIEQGIGSNWLTGQVQPGDTLRLSPAQGRFTPGHAPGDAYLFLAAGCGITPVMSMTRWLLSHRPEVHLTVLYHVRREQDVIFADEWRALVRQYPRQLTLHRLIREHGREHTQLSATLLAGLVPDIAARTVMSCGPESYMQSASLLASQLGVPSERIHSETFLPKNTPAVEAVPVDAPRHRIVLEPWGDRAEAVQGGNLLAALEAQGVPMIAACRSGDCGSCKLKVLSGDYRMGAQTALSAQELAEGWVLACCCSVEGDLVVSQG